MKKIFFLIILTSCSSPNVNNNFDKSIIKIDDSLSFNEVKTLLEREAKIKEYPEIDD